MTRRLATALVLALCALGGGPAAASEIDWLTNLQDAQGRAAAERAPVMIDFYADWCGWCRVLDQRTYSESSVQDLAERVVPVKVNTDLNPSVARYYGVRSLPTILFLDRSGKEITRIVGYRDAAGFAATLQSVLDPREDLGALESDAADANGSPEAAYRLADAYLAAGRHDDAIRVLTPLADGVAAAPSAVGADATLDLAHALYQKGDYAGATARYQTFIRRFPQHERRFEARLYLAHALEENAQAKEAERLYSRLRKDAKDTWEGHEARRALKEMKSSGTRRS